MLDLLLHLKLDGLLREPEELWEPEEVLREPEEGLREPDEPEGVFRVLLGGPAGGTTGGFDLASLSDAGVDFVPLVGVLLDFGLGRWSGRLAETIGDGVSILLDLLFAVSGSGEVVFFLPLLAILSLPICLACFRSVSLSFAVSFSLYCL